MHLLFVDESGTPPGSKRGNDKYFVIGGIIIPDGKWHGVRDALRGLKTRHRLLGELKWRYFAPGNKDEANPMRFLTSEQRDVIRTELYKVITGTKSIKIIACISSIQAAYETSYISNRDDLYHYTYKPLAERFQYHLQDLSRVVGRMETGIVIADHRGAKDDARFRAAHEEFTKSGGEFRSNCANLVESLFFQPSDMSVGIQLADMVAGAVWRKFEKDDDRWFRAIEPTFRKSPSGVIDGYGIVKLPKKGWR